MKHPSSAKVFEFVEKLEVAAATRGGGLCNMHKTDIEPECGTPGCHAGWAAIAIAKPDDMEDFVEGVIDLNDFLGFPYWTNEDEDEEDSPLEVWAGDNPNVWGYAGGNEMFCSPSAFGQKKTTFPVQVLIDHWRGVGERLKAIEEAGT